MEGNSGLPPEILVLCTTTETKEQALRLLDWIRGIPEIRSGLACEPAIPAVCSLIASEQLGNTVVTERRALQWSRTTPEHFRMVMNDVQGLITDSRIHHQTRKRHLTYRNLVDEFCQDGALSYMADTEEIFRNSPGSGRWKADSEPVQAAIFFWTCYRFKIQTTKSLENIQKEYNIFPADFSDVEDLLDAHSSSIRASSSKFPDVDTTASSSRVITSLSDPLPFTPPQNASANKNLISLEELANEFGVSDEVLGGMEFLETRIRGTEELRNLVAWDSTMGRCVIFYWTCSVLKMPSAKHITLRNQYSLAKKDFDKLLSALDLHRADLRKRLEKYYEEIPPLQSSPQGTQWPATSPANVKPPISNPAGPTLEKPAPPGRKSTKKGNAKRGRPPKPKSPPPSSTEPTSSQEETLFHICQGLPLQRALILLRSFNARRLPASDSDRVPPKSIPPLVALLACQQLGDRQFDDSRASQASGLPPGEFRAALHTVHASIDSFHSLAKIAGQTAFDGLALEHGLSIDAIYSMLHVRESLKESRCLSISMDWNSPLVICSVFFWTCAILKVPDVKQTLLRSRSLASKREFDSMLQLLNSHCTAIRRRLEDGTPETIWFAPPPPSGTHTKRPPGRPHLSFYGEQEIVFEDLGVKSPKRVKSRTDSSSEFEQDLSDGRQTRAPRKQRRLQVARRPPKRDEASVSRVMASDGEEEIYRPTTQFPPADWIPPQSSLAKGVATECPTDDVDESRRFHTRYSTLDYEHMSHDRFEVWKPEGEEVTKQLATYQQLVERMTLLYGSRWEQNIERFDKGIPFE